MIYMTIEEARASGHSKFWRIGFNHSTMESNVIYLDRSEHPDPSEAARFARKELNAEPTSHEGCTMPFIGR